MATVPRLEMTGTVGGALPSVRQTSVASPELFAEQGAMDMAFGDAMMKASDPIARIALEEAEKTAVSKVQEARTELGNRTMTFFEEMRKNNVGAASAGVTQNFRDWHKKQVEEIGKNLPGTDVQRAFLQQAAQHGLAARGEAANFEHSETTKYRTDTYNRTNDNLVVQAATATTDLAYIDARNSIVANVQARAMTEKWDEKQTEDNMRDTLSKMHEARAKALATDVNGVANPRAALEYIKGVDAKEVNPLVRAQLTAGLKQQSDKQTALTDVTELMKTHTPKNKEEPIPFEDIDAALRAKYADNPEALAFARAEAQFRTSTYNNNLQQIENKSLSALYGMYNKNLSPAQIQASPEYMNAGEKAKLAFNKMMADEALRKTQHAAAAESRDYTRMMRNAHILERDNKADTLPFLNPARLRDMDEFAVLALQGKIGLENMQQVHAMWRTVRDGGEKMKEAQLDHDTFMALARNAGVLPTDRKATKTEESQAVQLKNTIETEMRREQEALKKPLTMDDRTRVIQRVVDAKVIEERTILPNKTIKAQLMSDQEILERIPDGKKKNAERMYIEELLVASNQKITDVAVADLWRRQMISGGNRFISQANARYPSDPAKARAAAAEAERKRAEMRNTGG